MAPPEFAPFMLRGLTYGEVLRQMRVTGCAGRRNHWCNPVLVIPGKPTATTGAPATGK